VPVDAILDEEEPMPDYPLPPAASALVRTALNAGARGKSIRVLEHAVWRARQDGLRLLDTPEELVSGLEWLGVLYLLEDRPDRALPALTDALKCRSPRLGADHPRVRYLLARLKDAYVAQGKPMKAIPKREERLAADEAQHGDAARRTIRSRYKLFDAYWSAGRIDDAFELFRSAAVRCEREHGPDAAESIDARHLLAWAYLDAELPGGIPLLERNIKALPRAGCRPTMLAMRHSELAMVYLWWGRPADAVTVTRQALENIADLDDAEARMVRKELARRSDEAANFRETA
jgi:tetratricopeptide (TPR) repeat protein